MLKERFTILLEEKSFQAIFANTKSLSSNFSIAIEGNKNNWRQIKIEGVQGELVLNSLIRTKPMDQFSKLILGMYNFLDKKIQGKEKKELLYQIANTQLAIGVVCSTKVNEEIISLIKKVLSNTNFLIFNGETILNKEFKPL